MSKIRGMAEISAPAVIGKNRIINGKMEIAQRGTSFPATSIGAYTLDRFSWAQSSSAAVTISQQADGPIEFKKSLRIAVTTADTTIATDDFAVLEYKVEGYDIADLVGKTCTISFWVRSSKTGVHCLYLRNSVNSMSYVAEYTVGVANAWEFKTVVVVGGIPNSGSWDFTNGAGVIIRWALAVGSVGHTNTTNTWLSGSFAATPAQVNCLDTVGNIFAITGVQLEAGSEATQFEHRLYGNEFALCQRYYQTGFIMALAKNSNYLGGSWILPVRMRAAPSGFYSADGVDNRVKYDGGNYATVSAGGIMLIPTLIGWDAIMSASSVNWWSFDYRISAEL